jgi:hypothetical protein
MEILSDAEWLEEDLPALHNLTLRILVLELLASGFNDTFCASLKSQQRETSLGFIGKEEKKIRKIKLWWKEYGGERAGGFIDFGVSCLACINIVLRYA